MNATTDSTGQGPPPPQLPPGMPPSPLYLCRDSTFMNIARTIMPLVTVPVLVTNTLMLLVTWKAAKTRLNPFFFVSLAISDLLTGLFVLPIDLAYMFDPDISTGAAQPNASLCTLSGVFFHILQAVSLFSFFALSFDRFLSIAYPLEYILADKEKWNILSVAFIWMIPSTMYGVMVMAGYGKYEFKCWQGMCNIGQVDMNYLTFLMLTCFVVFMSTYAINGRIVYIKMYYGQNIIDMEQSVEDSTGQRPKIYSSIKAAKYNLPQMLPLLLLPNR